MQRQGACPICVMKDSLPPLLPPITYLPDTLYISDVSAATAAAYCFLLTSSIPTLDLELFLTLKGGSMGDLGSEDEACHDVLVFPPPYICVLCNGLSLDWLQRPSMYPGKGDWKSEEIHEHHHTCCDS